MLAWPIIAWTARRLTPAITNRLAAVCRRRCQRNRTLERLRIAAAQRRQFTPEKSRPVPSVFGFHSARAASTSGRRGISRAILPLGMNPSSTDSGTRIAPRRRLRASCRNGLILLFDHTNRRPNWPFPLHPCDFLLVLHSSGVRMGFAPPYQPHQLLESLVVSRRILKSLEIGDKAILGVCQGPFAGHCLPSR